MSQTVFNIISKDPQVEHVSQEVNPPRVHKHGCEKCREIPNRVRQKTGGHESPALNKGISATEFQKENQHIHHDQSVGDYWSDSSAGIIITNRHHKIFLLSWLI